MFFDYTGYGAINKKTYLLIYIYIYQVNKNFIDFKIENRDTEIVENSLDRFESCLYIIESIPAAPLFSMRNSVGFYLWGDES